jgi:hypothetical protein
MLKTSETYKLPFIPANLMLAMFITKVEESLMGIKAAATVSSQDMLGFPGSSNIGGSDYRGTQLFIKPVEKRGGSEMMSSVGTGRKRHKDDQIIEE